MKVQINTQVKNESLLLEHVLPFWKEYPVDRFVFYDDRSSDNTSEVICDILGDRAKIFTSEGAKPDGPHLSKNYDEAHMRSTMMNFSRSENADSIIALDADELISKSILDSFNDVAKASTEYALHFYWHNVVGGSLKKIRQDPLYAHNYRVFIVPLKFSSDYDMSTSQQKTNAIHETPRTPTIHLPPRHVDRNYGFIHLQAINARFYALKQLFYKVFEHVEYGRPAKDLFFYDEVVNNFNFCEVATPPAIIGDWNFDASVFDKILEQRNYEEYIRKHATDDLITFGREYLYG